jgi:hemoglobin
MCADAGPAMQGRQAETTLFQRVGGREGLRQVVEGTVQRHLENEEIRHLFDGVDTDRLQTLVTDFLVVGTGGEGEYAGRDMHAAHAHLQLTNAEFLSAGGDLGAAMESAGWGENEQQELLCAFVSLRGEVVAP